MYIRSLRLTVIALAAAWTWSVAAQTDPLPSWNDGAAKQAIVSFVADVTREGSPDFVPVPERIATFDNDGTLIVEQPMYSQFVFALDRVKEMAPLRPEWKDQQPFKDVLDGNLSALAATGETGAVEIVAATHAGMTTDAFRKVADAWLATAKHPRFDRPYDQLVYQPMLEVIDFLQANGFKTFIVTGGGVDFVRAYGEKSYGIPPEHIVGSRILTRYETDDGLPTLFRMPDVDFVDDRAGKPVGIEQQIGRRPIAAFGNSDGDLEMLQWTTEAGERRRLGVIIHHTDAEREYAYDRDSEVGRLDEALDAAALDQWTLVDMKNDWKTIFPNTP